MQLQCSTGTGLALLAGAIALHAILPSGAAPAEPAAEAAWTPVFVATPVAPIDPQATAPQATATQAATAPTPVGLAVVPTPSSGSGVVLFRLWSNGNVDRRLTSSSNGLSYQAGWQPLQTPPGVAP